MQDNEMQLAPPWIVNLKYNLEYSLHLCATGGQ